VTIITQGVRERLQEDLILQLSSFAPKAFDFSTPSKDFVVSYMYCSYFTAHMTVSSHMTSDIFEHSTLVVLLTDLIPV
jgi:hypothetical protein